MNYLIYPRGSGASTPNQSDGLLPNVQLTEIYSALNKLGSPTAEFVPYYGLNDASGDLPELGEEVATWVSTNDTHTITFTSGNRPTFEIDSNLNEHVDFAGNKYGTNETIAATWDETGKTSGEIGQPHTFIAFLSLPTVPDDSDLHIFGMGTTSVNKITIKTENSMLSVRYLNEEESSYRESGFEQANGAKVTPTAGEVFGVFLTSNGEKAYLGYLGYDGSPVICGQVDSHFATARTFTQFIVGGRQAGGSVTNHASPKIYQMAFWDTFLNYPRNFMLSLGSNYSMNNGSPTGEDSLIPKPVLSFHFSPLLSESIDSVGGTVKAIKSGFGASEDTDTGFDGDKAPRAELVTDTITIAAADLPAALQTYDTIASWTMAFRVYLPENPGADTTLISLWDGSQQQHQLKYDFTSGGDPVYQLEFRRREGGTPEYINWKTGLVPGIDESLDVPINWVLVFFGYNATTQEMFACLNDGAIVTNPASNTPSAGTAASDLVIGNSGTGSGLIGVHSLNIYDIALTQEHINAIVSCRTVSNSPSHSILIYERF